MDPDQPVQPADDGSRDVPGDISLDRVLARMTEGFFSVDRDWRFTGLNPAAEEMLGHRAGVTVGSSMWTLFPDLAGTELEHLYRQVMLGGSATGYCAPFLPENRWYDLRLFPTVHGISVSFRDVMNQRDMARRQLASEEQFRLLVEGVPAVIYSHQPGADAPFTYLSPYIEDLTGYPVSAFHEDRVLWSRLIHPADLEMVLAANLHPAAPATPFRAEYRIITRSGTVRWVADDAVSVDAPGSGQRFWQGILRDISPLKEAQEELRRQAHHDALTGLSNRTALDAYLGHDLPGVARPTPIALLFIDLDRFKMVNDAYGHDAGDRLLQVIARRLEDHLAGATMIARLGGDEFIAVIPNASIEEVTRTAEALVDVLRQPITLGSFVVVMGCSVGVAVSSPEVGPQELLRFAGLALQRAKALGRDQVAGFTPNLDLVAEQLDVISGLRRALERNELEVYYQPVVDCLAGTVVMVEALIRWHHPQRGLVLPGQFLPIVEDTSLIATIGDWVIEQACRQFRVWQDQQGTAAPWEISVNVAVRQLFDPTFPARVSETLRAHGLHAKQLRLELSERTEPAAMQMAVGVLEALLQAGIRLSLDDFGAGSSSLAYFRSVQADDLKLDRKFVELSAEDERSRAILDSMTSLGHALGLMVTAEGVETEEQLRVVQAAGCDRVQGYLTGRPMAADDLSDWLTRTELPGGRHLWEGSEDGGYGTPPEVEQGSKRPSPLSATGRRGGPVSSNVSMRLALPDPAIGKSKDR